MKALPGREGEVDERDLGGDLWGVVRVGQLGGDVELEVLVVGNDGVSELDDEAAGLSEGLFEEDGLQGGVQLLPHVLQQTRLPEPNRILKTPQEILIRELDHIHTVISLLQQISMQW